MDKDYYNNAMDWYNAVYVKVLTDRIFFFFIACLILVCVVKVYLLFGIFYSTRDTVKYYITYTNHKDGDMLTLRSLEKYQDISNSLCKFAITKYVENMESIVSKKNNRSVLFFLKKKANVIKNTSSQSVYQKYVYSVHQEDGDLSLYITGKQKIVNVISVDFVTTNEKLTDKVYAFTNIKKTNMANVVFTVKTVSNEDEKIQKYIAKIVFLFDNRKIFEPNQVIDFKVVDYSKVEIGE